MSNAGEWAARLKAFHEKQLDRPRKVYRVGRTKVLVTGGQAASTVGAAVASASVDSPTWLFLGAVVGAFFGGKYLYPIPRSSAAARRGGSSAVAGHPEVVANAEPAHLIVPDVQEYERTAARHDLLKRRWLTYEVDPQKQFEYPAMCDASLPATSAMIRAMRAADQARIAGNPADYKLAVDRFSQALQAAEKAAGVP